jgi:hypothetical protein
MDVIIPERIPKGSLLDRSTRWFRGFILVPPARNKASRMSTQRLVELDTSELVQVETNPGLAHFASFDGRLSEFTISRRSKAIISLVSLALPSIFLVVLIEVIIANELGTAFGPIISVWLSNSPEWISVAYRIGVVLTFAAVIIGTFALFGSAVGKLVNLVQYVLFPFPLYTVTAVMSSSAGADGPRFVIAKGGQPTRAISRMRLARHRNFETLLFFSPTRQVVRRVRLPTVTKNILQTVGEKVSLLALAEKLSETHAIPLIKRTWPAVQRQA